jgi:hypothetical protein
VPQANALYQVERLALFVNDRKVADFMGTPGAKETGAACGGGAKTCFVAEPPAYQEPGVDVFTAMVERGASTEESARVHTARR